MSHRALCKATNKNGLPCRAFATPSGYCFFHSDPDRATELGRAGGRKNRHVSENPLPPLPTLETVDDVRAAVAQVTGEVRARQLDATTAKVIILGLNLTLRILADAELIKEVEELRKQQAEVLSSRAKSQACESPLGNSFSGEDQMPAVR